MNNELLKYCRYYKGEEHNPFPCDGRSVWWRIESYGVNAGDKTNDGLSPAMLEYLHNRVWHEGWIGDTTWEEAQARAKELYDSGKWCHSYITRRAATLDKAY